MTRTAPANYANVRRHLGRNFPLGRMATGRRSGQRWTEGVRVRTTLHGVEVDYAESSGSWGDGSHRTAKLKEVRSALEQRWAVTDHPYRSGVLVVADKTES